MPAKRTIGVFTGNRAEYGLQFPILKAIERHPDLAYRLLVSGAHLDPHFGRTLQEIQADGFEIHAEVRIDMGDDGAGATSRAIGTGVLSVTEALQRLQPDLFVVYADRFEGFAAVIAGSQMNVPIAHIEGGDLTEGGALDDSVRHAMTKLSHLHFTTNAQATNRILAMGEEPWRVHTVGFPAIDLIAAGNFATPAQVAERLAITADRPIVLFTQHSVTTEFELAAEQVRPSLDALAMLAAEGVQVIVTYPNNDAGGRLIIEELERFRARNTANTQVQRSLGRYLYHGVLGLARLPGSRVVCAGNSSSGLKETPAFGCPAVNIGSRQDGRLRGENVLDAGYSAASIHAAIRRGLDDAAFRSQCRDAENPYGIGDAGIKIAEVLAREALGTRLIRKKMTSRGESADGWYR
jgi:UDP-N-acetylglucosamine 2-epimerase (non-hydrolysing)/GDP/UDP-N,N'-diacetylbacillosamine 2-epimerase (hydrolysing)